MELTELIGLMVVESQRLFSKQLDCAPSVANAIRSRTPERSPGPASPEQAFYDMLAIAIIEKPSYEPNYVRLIRHDGCFVNEKTLSVSHDDCTVVYEGVVTFDSQSDS